jgi:hypothetical protein
MSWHAVKVPEPANEQEIRRDAPSGIVIVGILAGVRVSC